MPAPRRARTRPRLRRARLGSRILRPAVGPPPPTDISLLDDAAGADALQVAADVTLAESGSAAETFPASKIARRTLSSFTATSGTTNDTQQAVTPTGQQQDDRLVAWVATVGGANTITGPSGWTEITPQVTQGNTTVGSLWEKRAGTSESGTTYTWTGSSSRRMAVVVAAYYSLVPDEIVQVDGTQASAEGATAQQLDHNSLTPSDLRWWHLLATASNSASPDNDLVTFTQPGGYAELAEISSEHATSANVHMALADRELGGGATGTQTVTIGEATNRQLVGFEVVLASASVPTEVSKTLADSGSAADQLQVAAAVPLADGGTASDAVQVTVPTELADSGQAADEVQVAATVSLGDSAAGTDALQVTAAVTVTDTGSAAETVLVAVPKTLTDTGTGADAVAVAAAVPLGEQGSAGDALSVAAAATLTEQGAGADQLVIPKTLAEQGAAADQVTVAAQVPLAEAGAAADALALQQTHPLAEQGVATDQIGVSQAKTLAESGTAGDVLRAAAAVTLTDLAAAAENAAAAVLVALADTSAAADDLQVTVPPPIPPPRFAEGATTATALADGATAGVGRVEGALVGAGLVEGSSGV